MITYIIDALKYCFGYQRYEQKKLDFHEILYHIEQLPKDKIVKLNKFLLKDKLYCC